jgi:hypothetical protein
VYARVCVKEGEKELYMRPHVRTVMQSQIGTQLNRPLGQAIAQRIASVPGGFALLIHANRARDASAQHDQESMECAR